MRKRIIGLSLFLVVLLSPFLVNCSSTSGIQIPEPKGYMNDFADILSSEDESVLESILIQYELQTTNEIAVVTIASLGGNSIEEYSIALAEKWRVGKEGEDNGVIILVAKEEKAIRIEVGYGLEPYLTDADAKLIIDRGMALFFKEEDYAGGIEFGAYAIMDTIDGDYTLIDALPPAESGGWPLWLILILIVFGSTVGIGFIGVLIGGGSGYWSSGGIRFGGFGGGSFGGGGASGRW